MQAAGTTIFKPLIIFSQSARQSTVGSVRSLYDTEILWSSWHPTSYHAAYAARQTETMKNLSTAPQILSLSALELFAVEASVSEDLSDPTVLRQLESLGVAPTVRQDGPALELTVRDSAGTVLIQKSFAEETVLRALDDSSASP